jgi:hypothetical protein
MTPLTTPAQGRETGIADILNGPHIRRLLAGESPALVEVEPLKFFRIYHDRRGSKWRISRNQS